MIAARSPPINQSEHVRKTFSEITRIIDLSCSQARKFEGTYRNIRGEIWNLLECSVSMDIVVSFIGCLCTILMTHKNENYEGGGTGYHSSSFLWVNSCF